MCEPETSSKLLSENDLARVIVDAAWTVHRSLGPGLLESVYEAVLARELESRGLHVERQCGIPIVWKGQAFDEGFRADLIVNGLVIVEIKSVISHARVFKAQLLTYLRLADKRLGLLVNFGEELFKDSVFRVVNGLEEGSTRHEALEPVSIEHS